MKTASQGIRSTGILLDCGHGEQHVCNESVSRAHIEHHLAGIILILNKGHRCQRSNSFTLTLVRQIIRKM